MKSAVYMSLFGCAISLCFFQCKKETNSGPTSINGQVLNAGAGTKPIPFAVVTLQRIAGGVFPTNIEQKVCDSNGMFHFDFNAEERYDYKIEGFDPYCERELSTNIKKGATNESVSIFLRTLTLPPITQEGRNTVGFLVNGRPWQPNSYKLMVAKFGASYSKGNLNLYAGRQFEEKPVNDWIGFVFNDSSITDTGTYKLTYQKNGKYTCGRYTDHTSNCEYFTSDDLPGVLHISRLDQVIAGTFEMTLVNGKCDTVRITNGRFDLKF